MTEKQVKTYFEIYTDCWKFFHKWCEEVKGKYEDKDTWYKISAEAKEISKKYNENMLCVKVVIATINELQEIARKE